MTALAAIAIAVSFKPVTVTVYGPYGRLIVADVNETFDPDVIAVVFRIMSVADVPTEPCAIAVAPAKIRKNDAVPVATALAEVIVPNVATAAVDPLSVKLVSGVLAHVRVARTVSPDRAVRTFVGAVPE
jgi:hypothetical protein